ncbi:lysosomal alpha-glucosidase-like [Oppia nitens]|uniref:lysosomal alpha-glucosidase-like n=1 Tax=Oppia nitens TaxID=1686743 RepID=UPI0023DC09E2|nr:lysosomal alpha-glucosidase-like [Oppia nitens]
MNKYYDIKVLYGIAILAISIINICNGEQCANINIDHRIDCTPEIDNVTLAECTKRKCCFNTKLSSSLINGNPKYIPTCFMPTDYMGYKVTQVDQQENEHGTVSVFKIKLERQTPSGFPAEIPVVTVEITLLNDRSLRLRFTDIKNKRYEPTLPELNLPKPTDSLNAFYKVNVDKTGLLEITRLANGAPIFQTDLTKLIYTNQFIQLKSKLSSPLIYGIGEQKAPFLKDTEWHIYSVFNHEQHPINDRPLYGSHPFHLNIEDKNTGLSNGVYLRNSNAMDILLQPEPAITWRPIGGIIDIFVFVGQSPDDVVRQYVSLVGKPAIPPFWSLGYHQCRCCSQPDTLAKQMLITNRTIAAGIPFDVQWNAKEYMVSFNDFTLDELRFGGFGQWIEHLHDIGMHYVPIIDPGIDPKQPKGTYPPYDDGVNDDLFVKTNTNTTFVGHVWNKSGYTVFPDFTNPKATDYWTKQFRQFHKIAPIDGAWNDMNEISNSRHITACPKNSSLEYPPYLPKRMNNTMYDQTICMTSKHHIGVHYDVHNLYSLYMAIVTDNALKSVRQKRSFIISRSTSPGMGQYAGHWNGDVYTTYDEMAWTIPSIMNMNMFGIPLVGADICGFTGSASNNSFYQEMCARWIQLGAFYPFARNHNEKHMDQDPVAMGSLVTRAYKQALETRYTLIPYLYTLFYKANTNADTIARPVFMEYPRDPRAYDPSVAETQFMWGSALMMAPVTKPNVTKLDVYLPSGIWYPYSVSGYGKPVDSSGKTMQFETPLDKVNVFLKGGNVVPILPSRQTTTAMRKEKFTLVVVLDHNAGAEGQLYWDDGDSIDPIKSGRYSLFNFDVSKGILSTHSVVDKYREQEIVVNNVIVLGLKTKPNELTINDKKWSNFSYEESLLKLTIDKIELKLNGVNNQIVWK